MEFLTKVFTWWNGQTLGTQFFTWRKGRRVGEDGQGNVYYQNADGSRRWVIYNGEAEASRVSPEWHGWLHHTYQEPPTVAPLPRKPWEQPYVPEPHRDDAGLSAAGEHARRPGRRCSPTTRPGRPSRSAAVANSVAEAVIGAVVLATAAGFVVYAGQTRGLGCRATAIRWWRASAAPTASASAPTSGSPGSTSAASSALDLDPPSFEAHATFSIRNDLKLPDDSDVKIASESLLGGNFVEITPGASETIAGGRRRDRQHARVGQPAEPADALRDREVRSGCGDLESLNKRKTLHC